MLHRVKFTKCEMYGSATKLMTALGGCNAMTIRARCHFSDLLPVSGKNS